MHKKEEAVIAGGSEDRAPRVAIVLSSFAGGADHFGNKVKGLPQPRPVTEPLTESQVEALLAKAVELGDLRGRNLPRAIAPGDWVLIESRGADERLVRAMIRLVARLGRAGRISIAAPEQALAAELAKNYPKTRFECVDLAREERIELPVPGATQRTGRVPKTVSHCDKRIVLAALARGSGLTIGDLDQFSFHPAEYAVLTARNLIVAGMNAVSVDAAGCAILSTPPEQAPLVREAAKKGYGLPDLEAVWVRGNEIEDAQRALKG